MSLQDSPARALRTDVNSGIVQQRGVERRAKLATPFGLLEQTAGDDVGLVSCERSHPLIPRVVKRSISGFSNEGGISHLASQKIGKKRAMPAGMTISRPTEDTSPRRNKTAKRIIPSSWPIRYIHFRYDFETRTGLPQIGHLNLPILTALPFISRRHCGHRTSVVNREDTEFPRFSMRNRSKHIPGANLLSA